MHSVIMCVVLSWRTNDMHPALSLKSGCDRIPPRTPRWSLSSSLVIARNGIHDLLEHTLVYPCCLVGPTVEMTTFSALVVRDLTTLNEVKKIKQSSPHPMHGANSLGMCNLSKCCTLVPFSTHVSDYRLKPISLYHYVIYQFELYKTHLTKSPTHITSTKSTKQFVHGLNIPSKPTI
jgi:hypothetical protein